MTRSGDDQYAPQESEEEGKGRSGDDQYAKQESEEEGKGRTAFREEERRWRPAPAGRKGRRAAARGLDASRLAPLEPAAAAAPLPPGAALFAVPGRPGAFVVRRALGPPARQLRLAREVLEAAADPAAANSLGAPLPPRACAAGGGGAAAAALARLRWACLGPAYDWTARRYVQGPHAPLPPRLAALGAALAAAALGAPPRGGGGGWAFDAALVNVYRPGDALCGHRDDAERDAAAPLVALSLGGAAAVFLAGGATRAERPAPLLLLPGDAVVLGGAARRGFHGVPRVLPVAEVPEALKSGCAAGGGGEEGGGEEGGGEEGGGEEGGGEEGAAAADVPAALREFIEGRRISVSLRQAA